MKREQIKVLIELSTTIEEAKEVISKYTKFKTLSEKIAFLREMFDVEIIDECEDDPEELVYDLLLNAIIKAKYYA